jgi:hypothetical protein
MAADPHAIAEQYRADCRRRRMSEQLEYEDVSYALRESLVRPL